jgi:hypothetical protein
MKRCDLCDTPLSGPLCSELGCVEIRENVRLLVAGKTYEATVEYIEGMPLLRRLWQDQKEIGGYFLHGNAAEMIDGKLHVAVAYYTGERGQSALVHTKGPHAMGEVFRAVEAYRDAARSDT